MSRLCSEPPMAPVSEKSEVFIMFYQVLHNLPSLLHLSNLTPDTWPSHILFQSHYLPTALQTPSGTLLASGPLHLPFTLPGKLLPRTSTLLVLLLYLPQKTTPSLRIQNITPYPNFQIPALITVKPMTQFYLLVLFIFHL